MLIFWLRLSSALRVSALLTDAEFKTDEPVLVSKCGNCNKCTEICPCNAIKGETWFPGIERDTLVDATICITEREKHVSKLGFPHSCGLCIKACPFTRTYLTKKDDHS
jgi:epoxyqueuosine reductase QueG